MGKYNCNHYLCRTRVVAEKYGKLQKLELLPSHYLVL